MTVKEVIKIASTLTGREDIVAYVDGKSDTPNKQTLDDTEVMTRLVNLVVNELACSFIPLVNSQQVYASDRKVYYKNLSKNPLQILNVYDSKGNSVMGKVHHDHVQVFDNYVTVEYSYFPTQYGLEDKLEYQERNVPSRVLAYGVIAEYSIIQGCYKDAVMWHKRYEDSVAEICVPKNSRIKGRAWL